MFFLSPIKWAVRLIKLIVLGCVVYLVVSGVQVVKASDTGASAASQVPADAIVVFVPDATSAQANAVIIPRLQEAVALLNAKRAPVIDMISLTTQVGQQSAQYSDGWLAANGATPSKIHQVQARSFPAGLTQIHQMYRNTGVIVVTDPFKVLWTRGAASQAGLSANVVSPPDAPKGVFSSPLTLWKQASGVAVGRIIGYSRATWAAN